MKKRIFLSIITITLNNFEELLRTVESVRDLNGCEHIIINGGECPQTLEFLQGYYGKSVSEPDQGISDAFNKGIRLSSGDAIIMLNSGDILLDRTYPARASQILDQDPQIDFVHADLIFEDTLIGPYIMRPLRTKNVLSPNIGRGMPYRHQSMIVRKEVYSRVGFFNLNYICSDFDWISRWELGLKKSYGKAYYSQGDPVIIMDGGGISSTQERKIILEAIKIIRQRNKHISFLEKTRSYSALFRRLVLFSVRVFLKKLGFVNILVIIKRIKYKRFLIIK
jgi:glycosyltransferase involved in cell wall biosynthesis